MGTTTTTANYENKSYTFTTDGTGNSLSVGSTLEYNAVGAYSITLPRGYYKFELWGAEGGGRRISQNSNSALGGLGGYMQGVYAVSSDTQTLYLYIGGQGSSSTTGNAEGGYNGGGQGYASSNSEPGNGGGGATHISTSNNLLKNLSGSTSSVIAVAGGGGGGGEDDQDTGGAGGGLSGGDGANSGTSGSSYPNNLGGRQDSCAGTGGGFGYGGGTNLGDGGGGGGGWYGGGAKTSTSTTIDCYGGGGGSGYYGGLLATSVTFNGTTYSRSSSNGVRYGNGAICITLIHINSAPTQKTLSVTGKKLGDTYELYSYDVASNGDYHTVGSNANGVYFMNSTTDKDNYSSAGIYFDSDCSSSPASDYVSWTVNSNQKMTLTFKKLPRTGADSKEDNKLTLYVLARDNFTGSSTSYNKMVGKFSFTVTFSYTPDKGTNTTGVTTNGYTYRYGTAQTTASDQAVAGKIYSPTNTSTWALSVQQVIDFDSDKKSFTVSADNLISNPNSTYYDVYIVPGTAGTGYSYSGTTATIYDWTAANTYSAKTAYKSVTVTVTSSNSAWYTANWTVYLVEKSSSKGALYEPPNGTTAYTLQVNFRANMRPTQNNTLIGDGFTRTLGTQQGLNASWLGQDPDYQNTGASDGTGVYFDTTDLFLDEALTISATSKGYIDLNRNSTSTWTMTYKKLPRTGVDSQENNKLKLYTRIRDNFGGCTGTYFNKVLGFTIDFTGITVSHGSNTSGATSGEYTYRYGNSTTTDTDDIINGGLYAATTGTYALNIQQVLKVNGTVTVPASSLLTDYNSTYYKAYIVPSALSGAPFTYTGTTTTIYDHSSTSDYTAKTGYENITIKCTGNSLDWQNTDWTLYVVESASVGSTNREPTAITYTGGQNINVTFRCGNIRPTLRNYNNVIDINVGTTTTYNLNTYFYDADGDITASTHTVEAIAVPQKEFVQLNKYGELVSVSATAGAASGTSYYNVVGTVDNDSLKNTGTSDVDTGFDTRIATDSTSAHAFVKYSFTGASFTLTGLRASYDMYGSSRPTIAYTDGKLGALTPSGSVNNPGHFYLLLHIRDKNDTSDDGIFLPIAIRVGNSVSASPVTKNTNIPNSEQSMMSVMPTADGNKDAVFYFTPMAINIGSTSHPIGEYLTSGGTLSADNLQGLAIDGDNFATSDGTSNWSGKINEFISITDLSAAAIVNSMGGSFGAQSSGTDIAENYYAEIELIDIYVPQSIFGGRVYVNELGSVPNGAVNINLNIGLGDFTDYYVTKGIKITLKSTTFGRYFYATVNLKDSNNHSKAVEIAIRVSDTALYSYAAAADDNANVVEFKESRRARNGYSLEYSVTDMPTLSYKVKADSDIIVTPYDIFGDYDMSIEGIRAEADDADNFGFTLNGFAGSVSGRTFTVGGSGINGLFNTPANFNASEYGGATYKAKLKAMLDKIGASTAEVKPTVKYSNANTYSAATSGTTFNDRLFFARATEPTTDAFLYDPYGGTFDTASAFNALLVPSASGGYISHSYGDTVVIDGTSYNLDFIRIHAAKRSTPQQCEYVFAVRDRAGNSVNFRISVEIVNTDPRVNDPSAVKLAAKAVTDGVVLNTDASIYVGSLTNPVMNDRDEDILSYITSRGVIIANTPDLYTVLRDKYYTTHTDRDEAFSITSLDKIPSEYLVDAYGNDLATHYVSAQMISGDRITVHALGSTKNMPNGVFVYFFVTDGRGGEMLGYKQVEVENTPLVQETAENGFDPETDNTWTIESTSGDDYVRTRYIVGSQDAVGKVTASATADNDADKGLSALDIDVKVLAKDQDSLSGVVLSQRDRNGDYVLLSGGNYDRAVPNVLVATSFADIGNSAAAVVAFVSKDGVLSADLPMTDTESGVPVRHYFVDLLFYADGIGWKTRGEVVSGLADGTLDPDAYFDGSGRWKIAVWALSLRSDLAFAAGVKLGATFSIADETRYGGDTAGLPTAYNADRTQTRETISARMEMTVYQQIYGTGIRTLDEYAKYDSYYAVTAGGKNFVPQKVGSDVTTDTEYEADTEYSGAFRYSQAIFVPDNKDTVYVPMSYFGTLAAIATYNGTEFIYDEDYAGYDVRTSATGNPSYNKADIDGIAVALEIFDGTTRWSGNSGDYALNNNPYVTINTFSGDKSAETYGAQYYNKLISMASGGSVLYLSEQSQKLVEHSFGLTFVKKDVRTGARNLTLTLKLAKSKKATAAGYTDVTDINYLNNPEQDFRSVSVSVRVENNKLDLVSVASASDVDADTNVVQYDTDSKTYFIDVSMPSATTKVFSLLRSGGYNVAEYGNVYTEGMNKVLYSDGDASTGDYADYRDYAYFSLDSLNKPESFESGDLPYALTDDGSALQNVAASEKAINSVLNYYGKSSVADLGVADQNRGKYQPNGGIYGDNTAGSYDPDTHIGSGKEGYSGYFNVSSSADGRILNITSLRKTFINSIALNLGASATQSTVKAEYKKRGLVALYDDASVDPLKPSHVYYPLKIMVYDHRSINSAGWADASYVAVEFRLEVTNAAPTLKNIGEEVKSPTNPDETVARKYSFELAVGGHVAFNLYDFVNDPDISIDGTGSYRTLATAETFKTKSGITLETGDYLESLYKNTAVNTTNAQLLSGAGGLSPENGSNDVIMWMGTDDSTITADTVPTANYLSFSVNRRTHGQGTFEFTVQFYDSYGASSIPVIFEVTVKNQAPKVVTDVSNITMRAGDDFNIITTYYDYFVGGADTMRSSKNDDGSTAYQASSTRADYVAIANNPTNNTGAWDYRTVTKAYCDSNIFITDTSQYENKNVHLGYIALADDDTPWRLRITSPTIVNPAARNKLSVNTERMLNPEGAINGALPLSLRIIAIGACQTELRVTVIDGEGGERTHTFKITVISSAPTARIASDDPNTDDMRLLTSIGLEGVKDSQGDYVEATYNVFTTPYGSADMEVDGFDGKKHAKSEYDIILSSIAKDADSDEETNNMTLHNNGMFRIGDLELVRDRYSGRYVYDYFEIEITRNGKSFTLYATGYDPNDGYTELTFYIGDYGNDIADNMLEIKLRIYTLYSDMTNPDVADMSDSAYDDYLAGSHKLNVQACDAFDGTPTSYQIVKLKSSAAGEYIAGSDGNTVSPIVDPDVSVVGKSGYSVKLYAFMQSENDPVPVATLKSLLKRTKATKTFSFADRDRDADAISSYLIGGRDANNNMSIDATDPYKLEIIEKYVEFSFSDDGTGMSLIPRTATLGKTVLLYVEVEKIVGDRDNARTDAVLYAGELLCLNVADSAPLAAETEDGEYNGSFEGSVGMSKTFTIFDPDDKAGSLFTDVDIDDVVTVDAFTSVTAYENALSAQDRTLDWKADAASGKQQAFTIAVNKDAGSRVSTLTVTVNRRIDKVVKVDGEDVYLDKVPLAITVTGKDSQGKTANAVILLTVCNTQATTVDSYAHYDSDTKVGYTFQRLSDDEYVIDAQVLKGNDGSNDLVINLSDFMRDADYSNTGDADSYVFVSGETDYFPCKYLLDEKLTVLYYADASYMQQIPLADIQPIFTDKWHYTGFKISAVSQLRNYQASAYVRIVDRATDSSVEENGVLIRIDITVMNDKPFVKTGMEATTEILIGSNGSELESRTLFIGDYVSDNNDTDVTGDASANSDTYLRVQSTQYLPVNNLYATSAALNSNVGDNPDSSALFTLVIRSDNPYNQMIEIRPKQGFYGNGAVEITVADGDLYIYPDTLTATFRINVQIAYNPEEITELNDVSTARGKTTTLSIDTLIPDIENTIGSTTVVDQSDGARNVRPKNAASFNPSSAYVLLDVAPQESEDPVLDATSYVSIKHEEGSSVWSMRALKVTAEPKTIIVKYAMKSDLTRVFENAFTLSVAENRKPNLMYDEVTFVRYSEAEGDSTFALDTNDTAYLQPDSLLLDPEQDIMTFVSVKSRKPSLVSVSVTENGLLAIKFNARGTSEITVTVADETDESVTRTFVAVNSDLPAPSFWMSVMSSFESHKIVWAVVLGCVLLLLVILIIVIAVVKKRKRAREELEAILVSEMEIEEQMLKLAGGPSPTGYQSYGYLQSTPGQPVDPNMLLGTGSSAPSAPMPELAPPSDAAMQNDVQPDDPSNGNEGFNF
ncbi:MAG: glycine rich domain-containing protein [Roseburia sp.]|nr:glycine rich domain-containing protein [Roseburia sp.]